MQFSIGIKIKNQVNRYRHLIDKIVYSYLVVPG